VQKEESYAFKDDFSLLKENLAYKAILCLNKSYQQIVNILYYKN